MRTNTGKIIMEIKMPYKVYFDPNITALDKIVYMAIYDNAWKPEKEDIDYLICEHSNMELANFCNCGYSTISAAINKLCKIGYLETANFDGRYRQIRVKMDKIGGTA